MDSANILDIFTCGICLETFDESSKCPRMLSCGHSFCHSCLRKLLAQSPCCPTCRAEILFQNPESIPINYSLKSLINIRSKILLPDTNTTCDAAMSSQRSARQQIPVILPPCHIPQTREALGTLCQSISVYAVEDRYDGTRYGKLALKDGQIFFNSFKPEILVDATIFALPELLSRFNNGSSELPKTAFLRVTPDGARDNSFEVIIETDGLTPRAKNFILFCSALKGTSYKGETMNFYRHFYFCLPRDPSPVVEGIREDDPETPGKEGGVYMLGAGESHFLIPLKDLPSSFANKFGVVVAGLQELKGSGGNCSIEECGLVI